MQGRIVKVSGPLIVAEGMKDCKVYDVVRVSESKLIGEIIELRGDLASIQVYEETTGIGPGEAVYTTDYPLSVELGPGIIENIFDGIQRPLTTIRELVGDRIERGTEVTNLNHEKLWDFKPTVSVGDKVNMGDILGTVQETEVVEHRIMVPPALEQGGTVTWIKSGQANIIEPIAKVKTDDGQEVEISMMQRWPVRIARPYAEKLPPQEPMITGQRSIDTFFPIVKGGACAVPGPFGSGKTVVQHQLAKWADADIIIYVGCGERGNEMTDVLMEFPELVDPKTGVDLMKRTVLIANTSDMPVAAREASIYTGITIGEYFRDMGYKVAIMADSTSRWAEALREMSGRLEEMPGEEGYPAYLSSRISQFYERAGYVKTLGKDDRYGSITAVGAVSPPGGDLSEPVTQGTLRIVKVFWSLSSALAYKRHFPAIDWLKSYSLYFDRIKGWYSKNVSPDWIDNKAEAMGLLQDEESLNEIVRLVGMDALSYKDQLKMLAAASLREDYLHQDAFNEFDSYASLDKQHMMMTVILAFYHAAQEALDSGMELEDIEALPVREKIARFRYTPSDQVKAEFDNIMKMIEDECQAEGGR